MNIHGAHNYWKQGALGAAGVRRVWAGAGPQRAAYRGGVYCAASRTACYYYFDYYYSLAADMVSDVDVTYPPLAPHVINTDGPSYQELESQSTSQIHTEVREGCTLRRGVFVDRVTPEHQMMLRV